MTTAARSGNKHQLNDQWSLGADVNYSETLNTGPNGWGISRRDTRSLLEFTPKAVANIATEKGELNIVTGIDLSLGESEFSSGRGNVQKLASAFVQATMPLSKSLSYKVQLGAEYNYIYADNSNADPKLDSYWLTNLAVKYTRDAWLASLRVDNLFDEQYASAGYYSNFGGVSYNGYYAGTGRAMRLTASYRF